MCAAGTNRVLLLLATTLHRLKQALWPKGYVFFPEQHMPRDVLRAVNHSVDNEVNFVADLS